MPEFNYAKGRILDSLQFISAEMKEFKNDYSGKTLNDYKNDRKLQKLMDRTVENILTALIEVCGTLNTERGLKGIVNSGSVFLRPGHPFLRSWKYLPTSIESPSHAAFPTSREK